MKRVVLLALLIGSTGQAATQRQKSKRSPSFQRTSFRAALGRGFPASAATAFTWRASVVNDVLVSSTGDAGTFARAGPAYCENGSGGLTALSANQPCIINGAIRIEPSVINYVGGSNDLGTGGTVSATTAANSAAGPTGATVADTLTSTGTSGRHFLTGLATSAGEQWVFSAYIKAVSTTTKTSVTIYDGVGEPCTSSNTTVNSTTWTRLYATCAITSGRSIGVIIYPGLKGADTTGESIYVSGRQLENNGDYPSSLIDTAGGVTATRAAETLAFPTSSNWPTTVGSMSLSFAPLFTGPAFTSTLFDTRPSGSGSGMFISVSVTAGRPSCNTRSDTASRAATLISGYSWTPDVFSFIRCSWNASNVTIRMGSSSQTFSSAPGTPTSHGATAWAGSTFSGTGQRALISNVCVSASETGC